MDRGAESPKSWQLRGGCAPSKSSSEQVSRTRASEAGRRRYAPSLRLQGARDERRGQADCAEPLSGPAAACRLGQASSSEAHAARASVRGKASKRSMTRRA